MRKVEIRVAMTVSGWADDGEADNIAAARIAFEVERRVNDAGDIRAHLFVSDVDDAPRAGEDAEEEAQLALGHADIGDRQ